jgi:hypothetical protein
MTPRALIVGVWLSGISFALAQTPARAPETQGPNTNVVRWHEGEIAYRSISDHRARGSEQFTIFVHPDKTRTLIARNDIFARNVIMNVVLRADENFRPIEAYAAYWNDGGFKGSGVYRVQGDVLTAQFDGPSGRFTQLVRAPEKFSLLTHPLAFDGWHGGTYDRIRGGSQRIAMLNVDAISAPQNPNLVTPMEQTWELLGTDTVRVPAGQFETEHYRVNDFDVWVTGADRILVKFDWKSIDREYVLSRYRSGP